MKQSIRYLRTSDGLSLAWAEAGQGKPLVRASNWLTHLEYDWHSPVWRHWTKFLASTFHYVRYDERGCGMTEWKLSELSCARWTADLESVIDAAGLTEPATLLGVSQGAAIAIAYAVKYPERVSGLILYGGYAVGAAGRDEADFIKAYRAMQELVRIGWRQPNPIFRRLFTSRFIPEGTEEQIAWFNELCQRTTTPEIAHQLLEARAAVDVRDLLPQVRVPTLVLHADGDEVVPMREGKRLATHIPGARFVALSSRNHILLEHERAWQDLKEAILEFTGATSNRRATSKLTALTDRETQIFELLCKGERNARIAHTLHLSEKTVRNHISRIYEKLGVRSRMEALVCAREHDFPA